MKKQALIFDENFIVTPHQVSLREKILFLGLLSVFIYLFIYFFVFFFWSIGTTTSHLQGLTHSKPAKCTKQVTLSEEHMTNELSLLQFT